MSHAKGVVSPHDCTMPNEQAEAHKAEGNKALQAGNLTKAIEEYTKAINADGANHVYFSNRSAAYLKKGDGNNALEDAASTIALSPDFSKGYSRKGGKSFQSSSSRRTKTLNDSLYPFRYSCAACTEKIQRFDRGI